MVRMKHLLRKLHIGGGGGAGAGGCGEHHAQGGISDHRGSPLPPLPASATATSSTTTSSATAASTRARVGSTAAPAVAMNRGQGSRPPSSSSPSPSASSATSVSNSSPIRGHGGAATDSDGSSGSRGRGSGPDRPGAAPDDFSFFEEEYQMQLALAISVSDPHGREDPESAQINAAKRMSLGCTPVVPVGVDGQANLVEFLSQRYWNYNILNYDEKVVDGFYDVYGIIASSNSQGKMPLLVDLQSVPITEKVDYEVILVNRTTDPALQQLEKHAISLSLQCRSAELGPFSSGLIQKIADLVVNSMGGPVCDADDMLRKWTAKSYELRTTLNSIILPLGCLEVGLSRHRALLFKVLADKINLPCRLVKGSYYTGTDEGAVNLIKVDSEREFIIDLMGAPGALIPAEIPSCHIQSAGFNLVDPTSITQTVKDLSLALGSKTNWQLIEKRDHTSSVTGPGSSTSQGEGRVISEPSPRGNTVATIDPITDNQRHEHDSSDFRPFTRMQANSTSANETELSVQQNKLNDVSKYVVSAVKNPEVAQKLHAMLVESGASPPPDLFFDLGAPEYAESSKNMGIDINMKQDRKLDQSTWSSGTENTLCSVFGPQNTKQKHGQTSDLKRDTYSVFENRNVEASAAVMKEKNSFGEQFQSDVNANSALPTINPFVDATNCPQSNGLIVNHVAIEVDKRPKTSSEWEMAYTNDNSCLPTPRANDCSFLPNPVLDGVAECEIPWEDLQIGERIGLGSYGEVYRADWNGTEVAVKKFLDQDLSGDALEQFRCEVKIMLRLRHPNVVLFMGAVTRPPNLSILTEFLPRGSLYRLLHRPNIQIDEKRRLKMALDVARGMNYLHTSHPPIVHRDLKSPNLLVDKNWVVKVCDFGLSRLKHHTFLSSKSTAGTPEWMAPEVLRNERSNEKCDVYSFGVILWELATLKMPWSGMNPMQVVGAVGFQNRRLDIPKEVDSMVADIIQSCWCSEPNKRPSFGQLMTPLKTLQRLLVETS